MRNNREERREKIGQADDREYYLHKDQKKERRNEQRVRQRRGIVRERVKGWSRIRWRSTNILDKKRDDANEQTLLRET